MLSSSNSTAPLVDVVVVSWNTRAKLERCLESLNESSSREVSTITVVDNGSTDGSREFVTERYPGVRLLTPATNLGFGRAVNLGAADLSAPWVVAANADIQVLEWRLGALLPELDPAVGVVAPKLVKPDRRPEESVYRFPSIWATLAGNLGVHRLDPRVARWLGSRDWRPDCEGPVDWAAGACLVVRRSAFSRVGGFSEHQWMYAEDLDLCYRLSRLGRSVLYTPQIVVLHHHGASAEQAFGAATGTAAIAGAYYDWLGARRGPAVKWTIGLITLCGASTRLLLTCVRALFARSWPAERVRGLLDWIDVNWKGLTIGGARDPGSQ